MKKALIAALVLIASLAWCCGLEAQQTSSQAAAEDPGSHRPAGGATNREQPGCEEATGGVRGTVVDPNGAVVRGALVTMGPAAGAAMQATTGDEGEFSFDHVEAGAFQLTVTAAGFAPKSVSGVVRARENLSLGLIALSIGEISSNVSVSPGEIAREQLRTQETQRLLGVIPNYYVSYDPHPEPLSARQKTELGFKFTLDPVSFLVVGAIAGVQQADNTYSGYGRGAQGYAKRYGAAYATFFDGVLIGKVLLPSLLKQDPLYLYHGSGTIRHRALYAMACSVVRKGDNGRWQPNYSSILGDLAAGGIANTYLPAKDRNGAGLTFQSAAINIAGDAVGNLVQEFLFRKVTTHSGKR